jgi:hypothetical protein
MSGEVIIGAVAVTLDRAAKVQRDKFVQTLRFSSGVPLKEDIFTRPMRHPQITQAGLSIAGIKVSDRGFIHLEVRASHHLVFDLSVDWL